MGILEIISMMAALAVTLGLFGLAVWAWRRFAPAGLLTAAAPRQRRMGVIETLVLEEQMLKMSEARSDYEAAIGFYQKSLGLLHLAIRKPGGG